MRVGQGVRRENGVWVLAVGNGRDGRGCLGRAISYLGKMGGYEIRNSWGHCGLLNWGEQHRLTGRPLTPALLSFHQPDMATRVSCPHDAPSELLRSYRTPGLNSRNLPIHFSSHPVLFFHQPDMATRVSTSANPPPSGSATRA